MSYCNWSNVSEVNKKYHDEEWGIPVYDDKIQFEYLMLEVMQCGLSWDITIKKREIFKKCFDDFDFEKIAKYNENDIERILKTDGMIKSKRKVEAIINNAKCFIKIRKEFESFTKYIWNYSDNKVILYDKHDIGFIPSSNGLSDKIAKDLKKRGFKFLGSITIYSHLQASGVINDHDKNCPRFKYINSNYPTIKKRRYLEHNVISFQKLNQGF